VRNNYWTCAHHAVNDTIELRQKGIKSLDLLLEDFTSREQRDLEDLSYHHMVPTKDVDSFIGYDAEKGKIMEPRNLKDPATDEDITTNVDSCLYNYGRYLVHI